MGDGAVLVEFPDAAEDEANAAAVSIGRVLRGRNLDGFHDAVPGARTLFCEFEPFRLAHEALAREIAAAAPDGERGQTEREHRIAVAYGGAAGLDLGEVARGAGMSPEAYSARHAASEYRVAFLGFAPGFAYLAGVPPELRAPRRRTPRTRVPARALAVAGPYAGIYPDASPGGWNLIGAAAVRLYDPAARPPVALLPGDRVRFQPCSQTEIESFARTEAEERASRARRADRGRPLLRVEKPGLWSTVCGAPRYGSGAWGIPPGGAMDLEALGAGNAVLGNRPGAAAIEISFSGPALEVLEDLSAVLTGAPCDAALDARPLVRGRPFRAVRGQALVIGAARSGARAYLCVGGALADGSIGPARRLAAGDILCRDGQDRLAEGEAPRLGDWRDQPDPVVRIVLGPQEERFLPEGVSTILQSRYRVSAASDRRGIRLEGPAIPAGAPGFEISPEGTALGAIQVPPDGLPIVLGPDRPVTGGYAKIGTVVTADFGRLAQMRPGSEVRFEAVDLAVARRAREGMNLP